MATSTYGTPYVESGDLVSNWPITSQSVADRVDDVSIKGNGVNTQTGTTYTTVLTDAGKTVTLDNAAAVAVTIPPNASVAYETGTQIKFLNLGAGTVTLGPGSGVTLNGDTLTADQYIGLAAIKVDTDEWVVLPFSGGVGSAQISDTPTGSYSGYQYWTYTASGTLTVTKAGFADVLAVAGGGGGGDGGSGGYFAGGGGGGGMLVTANAYLPVGSQTIVVGAGGAAANDYGGLGNQGSESRVGPYYAVGGGGGGQNGATSPITAPKGGSGGGAGAARTGGSAVSGQGNNGGDAGASTSNGGGGGGGAGAAGGTTSSNVGGDGGDGLANSFTGGSVTYAGGGGGGTATIGSASGGSGGGGAGGYLGGAGTSGTINRGGGGGASTTGAAGAGGSGVVIVRVAV